MVLNLDVAKHNQTGKIGEALAEAWFIGNGYTILHLNWRHKHWEIDIIASKNKMLHFIEVKTRTSLFFGYPEDNVSNKKIAFLVDAAEEYLFLYAHENRIQFDILAITLKKNEEAEYFLIEDIYL